MGEFIREEELKKMPNEELLGKIKDQGIIMYMHDESMKEARIKGFEGADILTSKLIDYTGLTIFRQTIREIEIIDEDYLKKCYDSEGFL